LLGVLLQAMGEEARAVKVARVDNEATTSTTAAGNTGDAGAGPSSAAAAGDDMQVDGDAGTAAAVAAAAVAGGEAEAWEGGGVAEADSSEDDDMTAEVIRTVRSKDDPLAAYDIDVEEDGEAIQMYLSMLESSAAGSSQGAS
jgi:hypothetical protein